MSAIARLSQTLLAPPRYDGAPFRLPPPTAWLCQAVRVGIVLLMGWKIWVEMSFALNPGEVVANMKYWQNVDIAGISALQIGGLVVLNLLLIVALQVGIYGSLLQLFTGFLRGQTFTRESGLRLRRAGLFDLAFVIAGPLRATLVMALLTAHLPEGAHWGFYLLNMAPLYDFVVGSVGFVLGQVFVVAAEMAAENESIV